MKNTNDEMLNEIKDGINDIKNDINDLKQNHPTVVENHNHKSYYMGFWGWLAVSSVASALASATVGIVKCLHGSSSSDE